MFGEFSSHEDTAAPRRLSASPDEEATSPPRSNYRDAEYDDEEDTATETTSFFSPARTASTSAQSTKGETTKMPSIKSTRPAPGARTTSTSRSINSDPTEPPDDFLGMVPASEDLQSYGQANQYLYGGKNTMSRKSNSRNAKRTTKGDVDENNQNVNNSNKENHSQQTRGPQQNNYTSVQLLRKRRASTESDIEGTRAFPTTFAEEQTEKATALFLDVPLVSIFSASSQEDDFGGTSELSMGSFDDGMGSWAAKNKKRKEDKWSTVPPLRNFEEAAEFFRTQITEDNEWLWTDRPKALPRIVFWAAFLFITVAIPVMYFRKPGPDLADSLDGGRTPFGAYATPANIVWCPLVPQMAFLRDPEGFMNQPRPAGALHPEQALNRLPSFAIWETENWEKYAIENQMFPNYNGGPATRATSDATLLSVHSGIAFWGALNVGIMVMRISWWPCVSYTMTSWNLFTVRHLMATFVLLFARCGGMCGTCLGPIFVGIYEVFRFPALVQATITFVVWWGVLVPVIVCFLLAKKKERGSVRDFMQWNFGFFQINVHGFNVLLAWADQIWLNPRPLLFLDLWFGLLFGILYLAFYLWALDNRGIHLYMILNPRSNWAALAYLAIFGMYTAAFLSRK
ncbi:unnamed protein product [Amoebophrya sp. A120]|nr:unnamed protein product [Amoebophrya sp. A120]|eukprot:GSA120T00018745001.1